MDTGIQDSYKRSVSFLPPEVQEKYKGLLSSGWYNDTINRTSYSGNPETQKEADWVMSFIDREGRKPTVQEAAAWRGQNAYLLGGDQDIQLAPGGTQYGLGFRTSGDIQKARNWNTGTFGPYSGVDVPQGGLVLTDKQGNVWKRVFDYSDKAVQQAIREGRYIEPPQGAAVPGQIQTPSRFAQDQGGPVDTAQYYGKAPQAPAEYQAQGWKQPTLEETLKTANQPDVYQYKMRDYIESVTPQDTKTINRIRELLANSTNIDPNAKDQYSEYLNQQLNYLIDQLSPIAQDYLGTIQTKTDDATGYVLNEDGTINWQFASPDAFDASGLSDFQADVMSEAAGEAEAGMQGLPMDAPYWDEVNAAAPGRWLTSWYNQQNTKGFGEWQTSEKQRQAEAQKASQDYQNEARRLNVGRGVPYSHPDTYDPSFVILLQNMGLSDQTKQYLATNYAPLYAMWMQYGANKDFAQWLTTDFVRQ
jgi:hypothetical protein